MNGVQYQKTLQDSGQYDSNRKYFTRVLESFGKMSGVPYKSTTQAYWASQPQFVDVLRDVIANRDSLGPHLSPKTGCLGIRAPCPHSNCGLCDKHGVNTVYKRDHIVFACPRHGQYSVDLNDASEIPMLGFSTPLRNLLRSGLVWQIVEIPGSS